MRHSPSSVGRPWPTTVSSQYFRWLPAFAGVLMILFTACAAPPGPIFPTINPPIVWPQPPDTPRIQYIGQLTGEESLGVQPTGWEAIGAAFTGPRPKVAFSRPTAVAVDGQRVYVVDAGLAAVHMLDLDTRDYALWQVAGNEPLRTPLDVVTTNGHILVADRLRACIDEFNPAGDLITTHRWEQIPAPVALANGIAPNEIWLADAAAHACYLIAPNFTLGDPLGGAGSTTGQFNFPRAIATHPDVGIVVVDAMNFRVQVFNPDGTFVTSFGEKGDAAGDFASPRDVAIDSAGHVYVLDNQFENVQIFNRDGVLLMAFGHGGSGPGEFSVPAGITIDAQDRIWIADSYNRRVQVFQYLSEQPS